MSGMRALLVALEVLGVASFVAGAALIYVPAGFLVAGALLVVVAERALAAGPSRGGSA